MRIEVRGNIWGELRKIRQGVVYKNVSSVITELVQNAQRSRAKRVDIEIEGSKLVVRDDGVGCSDPQLIFEKDTAGWENEEEAFGEGFFSTFYVADTIRVRSKNWEIEIDVDKMLRDKDPNCPTKETEEYVEGFEVELIGERLMEETYTLRNEARKLGQYVSGLDVTVNGAKIEKESIIKAEINPKYDMKVDNEIYEAVLTVADSWPFVDLFYESRPMKDRFVSGVRGKVHFKKGAVTPRAPDRKDLVDDKKERRFEEQLRSDAKRLYHQFVEIAEDSDLDQYGDAITEYLEVQEYLDKLKVDGTLFNLPKKEKEEEDTPRGDEDVKQVKALRDEVIEVVRKLGGDDQEFFTETDDPKDRKKVKLTEWLEKQKSVVWVRGSEMEEYRDSLKQAEYLGFVPIIAKNRLYEQAFEYLDIPHVSDFEENAELKSEVENMGPISKKEEIVYRKIFDKIEKYYGLPEGTIQMANLTVRVEYRKGDAVRESKKKSARGLYRSEDKKVYVDRQENSLARYRFADNEWVGVQEYRFLLKVGPTLAHELAHLMFGTLDNTLEHYEMSTEILKDFGHIL